MANSATSSSPYRSLPITIDPEPIWPVGCPCRCSVETRMAYAAVGGWWHTDQCDAWRVWYGQRTGRKIDRINFDRADVRL